MRMDRFEDTLRSRKTDLYSDTSGAVRLQHRPMHGKGFVGSENTFARASQSKVGSLGTNRPGNPLVRRRASPVPSELDGSDDELLLSSPPRSQDSRVQKSTTDRVMRTKGIDEESMHTRKGAVMLEKPLEFHPDFLPKKLPNFKKNKSANSGSPAGSQSSQGSVTSTKATVGRATTPRSPPRRRAASPDQAAATTSKQATKPRGRLLPLNELNSNDRRDPPGIVDIDSEPDPDFSQKTPRPTSQRPRPRPAYKGASKSKQAEDVIDIPSEDMDGKGDTRRSKRRKPAIQQSDSDDENLTRRRGAVEKAKQKGKGKANEPTNPIDRLSPVHHSSDEEPPQRSNKGKALKKARQPAQFPELPPLSNPSSSRRTKKSRQLEDFPMDFVSPVSSQKSSLSRQESQLRDFPQLPPLSSSPDDGGSRSRSNKAKSSSQPSSQKSRIHKGTVLSSAESDDDDDDDDVRPFSMQKQLQPFPMQTQLLESIGRSPPKRLDGHSSDLEDEQTRRARKKRRADADPDERYESSSMYDDDLGPQYH